MRPYPRALLLAAALVAFSGGCGTVVNLTSPPPSLAPPGIGPTACTPFGGAARSGLLGGFCVPCGLLGGWQEIGQGGLLQGAWMTGVGVVALLDTPLSLAGDVVTLPIAYARQQGAPWATWWGDQGGKMLPAAEVPEGTAPGADLPVPSQGAAPQENRQPATEPAPPLAILGPPTPPGDR
jgi:uncharacterized protein YceK